MGRVITQTWLPRVAGIDISRRDRAGGAYDAFVPDLLAGRSFALDGDVAADVADATAAIARLDGSRGVLANTETLARLLLRAESVASSHIEGLHVSPQRLLRADFARGGGLPIDDQTAAEVLANVDAMDYAIRRSEEPISVALLCAVHRRLLEPTPLATDHAGRIRTEQNWVGGSAYNPIGADFIPPPPFMVPPLLEDLCAFCNDDGLPAVAQAAIAHAQFETIHPFVDGNGRTGRALIHMILRRRGLAVNAVPPVSLALATRAKDYILRLDGTRVVGAVDSPKEYEATNRWIGFFSAACVRAVGDAESFEQRVSTLQDEWRARVADARSHSGAVALLEHLAATPILTVAGAATLLGRSVPAATTAIETLVARKILTPGATSRRAQTFEARELIDAFTSLERQLASPSADTKIEKPVRPVPARPRRP
jgi:Fic family protein